MEGAVAPPGQADQSGGIAAVEESWAIAQTESRLLAPDRVLYTSKQDDAGSDTVGWPWDVQGDGSEVGQNLLPVRGGQKPFYIHIFLQLPLGGAVPAIPCLKKVPHPVMEAVSVVDLPVFQHAVRTLSVQGEDVDLIVAARRPGIHRKKRQKTMTHNRLIKQKIQKPGNPRCPGWPRGRALLFGGEAFSLIADEEPYIAFTPGSA